MRFRQVHLDFHTSGQIDGIGAAFDKKQFQNALLEGHVDSITVFSKCHHGWSYHPTMVNTMHPKLSFDLLGAELEACREIRVKAPVYLSAGFDENQACLHPEWLIRLEDETLTESPDFFTAGYHKMCYNTGYLELLLAEIEEVMHKYHPEGIFLDISAIQPCYCAKCRSDIIARGKDYRDPMAVMEQAEAVYENYTRRVEEAVRKYSPDCTIFHNGGHIVRGRRDLAHHNTHLELESLPTGGWGYDHFPMSASYVMNLGMEYLGMTGKFHTTWGEFGGFKHPNALRYETALSLAFGAKCSVGDQLHPSGLMDQETYRLIGAAYSEVERKEEYCRDAVNCADIGILGEEAVNFQNSDCNTKHDGDIGANRIMLEGGYLYRFIDRENDLKKFKVIVLPDTIRLDQELEGRLREYLNAGGKILATGTSGLRKEENAFGIPVGAEFLGINEYRPDYLIRVRNGAYGSAHVMYAQGIRIRKTEGKAAAFRQNSYFNRDVLHFSSHQHTPNDPSQMEAAVVTTKNTVYIGWSIFADYGTIGALHAKELVTEALDQLLDTKKTIETDLPDKGIVTLTKQEGEQRYINHLLFAYTSIRGRYTRNGSENLVEAIEGLVPVYNVKVKVRVKEEIKNIYLAPQGSKLPFYKEKEAIVYTVPEVNCHQIVVMEY